MLLDNDSVNIKYGVYFILWIQQLHVISFFSFLLNLENYSLKLDTWVPLP